MGFEEFLRCRLAYQLPPVRPVVLTIDDAYADTRELAYPVLRGHGYSATVFVVSELVGGTRAAGRVRMTPVIDNSGPGTHTLDSN